MMQPSNTPPDGDFVRYVERLTAGKAAPGVQENFFGPQKAMPADVSRDALAGRPSVKAGLEPLARIPFLTHVKWVVVLWIATQALAWFLPGAGFLFIPVLALYAAWVIFSIRRKPPGAFFRELGEMARRAAEQARKSQKSQPGNKP